MRVILEIDFLVLDNCIKWLAEREENGWESEITHHLELG